MGNSEIPAEYLNAITTGDARVLAERLPDESVDLIFTDPPYPHEYLPLYGWLSEVAARVLKPGGLCLAYAGKTALPDVIALLGLHLSYYWLFSIYEPGTGASLWKWRLWGNHRPILGYSKGNHTRSRWLHDAVSGMGRDKRFHAWGQSQGDAEYFIYSLTHPGAIVFDPFGGGGTTAAACKTTGRNFVSFEIGADTAENARLRVAMTQPPLPGLLLPEQADMELTA